MSLKPTFICVHHLAKLKVKLSEILPFSRPISSKIQPAD